MIGQKRLKSEISALIEQNKLPRFIILVGAKGSGKKLMSKEIAKTLKAQHIFIESKVDAIRTMIDNCYKLTDTTVYTIADADTMSVAGRNAMLKVTEEPPNNAYFILTLQDERNTLDTIRSRGTVFRMNPYTRDELKSFAESVDYLDICETPSDVLQVNNYGVEFKEFVNTVVDNVAEVSGANAFKIGYKLNFADDTNKFDLSLFLRAFKYECARRMTQQDTLKFIGGIVITNEYLSQLRAVALNKQSLFDMWLLDIRREWMQYAES